MKETRGRRYEQIRGGSAGGQARAAKMELRGLRKDLRRKVDE